MIKPNCSPILTEEECESSREGTVDLEATVTPVTVDARWNVTPVAVNLRRIVAPVTTNSSKVETLVTTDSATTTRDPLYP